MFVLLMAALGVGGNVPVGAKRERGKVASHLMQQYSVVVEKWMQARATIASEKRVWSRQREHLENETALLNRSVDALKKERDRVAAKQTESEDALTPLRAKKKQLQVEQKSLAEIIETSEAALRDLKAFIPQDLQRSLATPLPELPAKLEDAEDMALTERARRVVALLTHLESIQNTCHVTQKMLTSEKGERRQVDVLYVGLARGFAVSQTNDWAAIGTPQRYEWHWHELPDLAGTVRNAIAIAQKQETAALVNLPLKTITIEPTPIERERGRK